MPQQCCLYLAAHTGNKCPSSQLSQWSVGINLCSIQGENPFLSLSGKSFGQLRTGNKAEGFFSIAESQLGETWILGKCGILSETEEYPVLPTPGSWQCFLF